VTLSRFLRTVSLGISLALASAPMLTQAEETEDAVSGVDDPAYVAASGTEKRYVTDELWLQLRTGPGSQYRILQALKTGEHLVLLGENASNGYSLVRTGKGREGWVLTRYLVDNPVAKERLILTQQELDRLKAEMGSSGSQIVEMQQELNQVRSEREAFEREAKAATKELEELRAISSNAVALDDKARRLTTRTQELEIQLEAAYAENAQLRDDRDYNYLLYGGALVILGAIGGLIIMSFTGRKRSSWN